MPGALVPRPFSSNFKNMAADGGDYGARREKMKSLTCTTISVNYQQENLAKKYQKWSAVSKLTLNQIWTLFRFLPTSVKFSRKYNTKVIHQAPCKAKVLHFVNMTVRILNYDYLSLVTSYNFPAPMSGSSSSELLCFISKIQVLKAFSIFAM